MPIQPVSGEIKAQPLNDNFSYLESLALRANGGPIDDVTSVSVLNSKYPNGANGVVLVGGVMYLWNGTSWFTNGTIYQAAALADLSVTKPKIADEAVNHVKTDFLESDTSTNLFDGAYVHGVKVTGVVPTLKVEKSGAYNDICAVIPIEPDTVYFLARQGETRLNLGTSSKELDKIGNGEMLSGYQYSGQPGSSPFISFRSKTNDNYLYVNVSLNGETPFLIVSKEVITDFGSGIYPVRPKKEIDILSKTDFSESLNKIIRKENMVNEHWVHGYRLGGSGNETAYVNYVGGSMKVQRIEPNKQYWVARKHGGRFKIATTTQLLTRDMLVDGSVMIVTVEDEKIFTFTTGDADRYLYIDVINDGSEPYVLLTDREISTSVEVPDDSFVPSKNLQVFTKQEVLALLGTNKGNITISYKHATRSMSIDIPVLEGFIRYQYSYVSDASINYQQWRVLKTYKLDNGKGIIYDLDSHTEWEGAIKEVGAADFMGGWHGDEINTDIQVLVDGKHKTLSDDFEETAYQEVKIINLSVLNRVGDNETKLLKRARVNTWTSGQYTVENKFEVLEDFEIERSMLTMLSCTYEFNGKKVIDYGRTDHDFVTYPIKSTELSRKQTDIFQMELFGDHLYCKASSEFDREKYTNAKQWIEDFGYRAKIYFDVTGAYSAKQGDVIRVKSIYEVM